MGVEMCAKDRSRTSCRVGRQGYTTRSPEQRGAIGRQSLGAPPSEFIMDYNWIVIEQTVATLDDSVAFDYLSEEPEFPMHL